VAVLLTVNFFYIIFQGYAPFIITRDKILNIILNHISFKDSNIIYELGSGKAGFLRAIEKKYPQIKKLIGIEYFFLPYFLSRIQLSLIKSNIKILNKNIFNTNFAEADVIYCYLNNGMMGKLKEKFRKECKRGAQIISYQFPLPNLTPVKVVDIEDEGKDKVYFYKM